VSLTALILASLCTLAFATGKLLKRKREEMERAVVDAELRRLWVYQFCELKEIPKP
jgi:hypothetical protein